MSTRFVGRLIHGFTSTVCLISAFNDKPRILEMMPTSSNSALIRLSHKTQSPEASYKVILDDRASMEIERLNDSQIVVDKDLEPGRAYIVTFMTVYSQAERTEIWSPETRLLTMLPKGLLNGLITDLST